MSLDRPQAPDPYSLLPQVDAFTLTSPSFDDGSDLPATHAVSGDNLSPALSWSGQPEGTASFLVTCYDPDAPTPSGFWHWCVVGVPADVTELPEGAGSADGGALPEGALTLANDFGTEDFGGAAPPPGDRPHRYVFAVTALDTADPGVEPGTSPAKAHFLTLEHVIGRATLTGTFAEPA